MTDTTRVRGRRPALDWMPSAVIPSAACAHVSSLQLSVGPTPARGCKEWSIVAGGIVLTATSEAAKVVVEDTIVKAAKVIMAARRRRR